MIVCFLLSIPVNQITILSAVAIAGGLYFFVAGFRLLARERLLLSTPASKIRSAAMGLVEVNGMAAGPRTLPAPITGKPCFLYHTTAWQQRNGKNNDWEKVADETLHLPFYVDDSTGKLLIEPLGADLDLHRDFREQYDASFFSSNSEQVPTRVYSFLARHGVVPTRHLRIEERLIKPDDFLFIAGTLAENPGLQLRPLANTESAEHGSAPQVIKLSGNPAPTSTQQMSQQAKIAAALTRAGITRPEAWSAAGVPYQSVAVEESTSVADPRPSLERENEIDGSGFNLTPPVVLMKGATDPTFVISYRSQKEFAGALAWKSAAMIWGGAAITVLGIYMLLLQLDLLQ